MSHAQAAAYRRLPWSVEDIPYGAIERRTVEDEGLLYLVASASFIEITSDLYTRNLVAFFKEDSGIVDWLVHHWEPEELQHGDALKRYVRVAWPDFDWDAAYRGFVAEYSRYCSVGQLAPTRALEMVARCVVETGTASFYRMLSETAPEPVLCLIASCISGDEVRHYKYFYRFFRRYCARENPGRVAVFKTLWARAMEVDDEDAYTAFKHVYLTHNPDAGFERDDYAAFRASVRRLAKDHFPYDMAMKMFFRPLELAPAIRRMVLPPVIAATRLALSR
jgi:hypothetical protein